MCVHLFTIGAAESKTSTSSRSGRAVHANSSSSGNRGEASRAGHHRCTGRLTSPIPLPRVFPETSIHECKVRSFAAGHLGPDMRSTSGLHRCRQGQLPTGPELPVAQPLRSQHGHRRETHIEVHRTGEIGSCPSHECVRFSASMSAAESESSCARCKDRAIRNALPRLELAG